jgi:hypothetical protein
MRNVAHIVRWKGAYVFQRVVLFEQKRKVKLFGSKGFALSTVEVRALLSD